MPLALFGATHAFAFGLDLFHEMRMQAKRKDRKNAIEWTQGDAQALPFGDQSFDCVFMSLVLHQVNDKGRVLRESYSTTLIIGKSLNPTFKRFIGIHEGVKPIFPLR